MKATGTKAFAILLFALLAASLACAATLEEFLTPYLYPGENYTADANVTPMDVLGGHYLVVTLGGQDAFLLSRSSEGAVNYSFVNDSAAAFSVLREYGIRTTYPSHSELAEVRSLIQAYDSSRYPREQECLQSVGLDRPGATCSSDRCDACMSVPVCAANMPYNGPDFVISIYSYGLNHNALSGALKNATLAIDAIGPSTDTAQQLDIVVNSLNAARNYSNALKASHLFGCFELTPGQMPPTGLDWCAYRTGTDAGKWCFPLTYNASALNSSISRAAALKGRIITNASLTARANGLLAAMQARANDRTNRQQNSSFQDFYAGVKARTDNATNASSEILSHIDYLPLQSDVVTLSSLMLNVSQYGAARNYSAANASAALALALVSKMDDEVRLLDAQYAAVLAANESASLALFQAQLLTSDPDSQSATDLLRYSMQKDTVDDLLDGKINQSQLNDTLNDLRFIEEKANGISAAEKSQLAIQGTTWLGVVARGVSVALIGAAAPLLGLSPQDKESYARTLPTLLTLLAGALVYLACIGAFTLLVLTRRLRLHKVAAVLWAIIFAFLFIMVALVTITAHSIVQKEASRSAYDAFSSALYSSPAAAVVVTRDGATDAGLLAMRNCSESMRTALASRNKTVSVYEYSGTDCISANGTVLPVSECSRMISDMPSFMLGYNNQTQISFYAYYLKSGTLAGNEAFHSSCNMAKVLNMTS